MMVGATWREGPVRSQALEGPIHDMPTVSPALSLVHDHVRQSGGCSLGLVQPCQWPLTRSLPLADGYADVRRRQREVATPTVDLAPWRGAFQVTSVDDDIRPAAAGSQPTLAGQFLRARSAPFCRACGPRSVRSLGAGREVIRVDPVAGERLRRAVLFMRSVRGGGQASRRRTLRRPQSTSGATLWRISTSAVTSFRPMGECRPCSVTMTIRLHRSSALANCPRLLV